MKTKQSEVSKQANVRWGGRYAVIKNLLASLALLAVMCGSAVPAFADEAATPASATATTAALLMLQPPLQNAVIKALTAIKATSHG
jgi:hypothetical protein